MNSTYTTSPTERSGSSTKEITLPPTEIPNTTDDSGSSNHVWKKSEETHVSARNRRCVRLCAHAERMLGKVPCPVYCFFANFCDCCVYGNSDHHRSRYENHLFSWNW